ncbi:hypothetical protein EOL99_03840 [Candidatus Falkowbacteria bacterium]|nr:hypothetical protein [Candidatus Falkowbacteria bacterium]
MKTANPIKILDAISFVADVEFTATASLITSASHGLKQNTIIKVASDDTLPAGLNASAYYYVVNVTTNTFQVATEKDGVPVAITDAGTGTHTYTVQGAQNPCFVDGFRHTELELVSDEATNDFTVKIAISDQEDMPNFNASASETNRWSYAQIKDLADGSSVNGATGITVSGTIHRLFEINSNKIRWVCPIVSSYVAGDLTSLINLADED